MRASACPLDVREVSFSPINIYKTLFGKKSHAETIQTADGVKTLVSALETIYDRTAWQATLCLAF
ncbi:MAG: hypothetical protein E7657_06575 [Ruminococcaceae bacterium]|nr:hypothetical protein [Oscillospiraceae bacterium]